MLKLRNNSASRDSRRYDGYLVGGNGIPVSPDSSIPSPLGKGDKPAVFFVNGIQTDVERQVDDMRNLARSGKRVVGIHNATAGLGRDILETVGDKLRLGDNPAVTTVKKLLRQSFRAGAQLSLVGHSQGALIISRALRELEHEMLDEGVSKAATAEQFSEVSVETVGGAAYGYPKGPKYRHFVNQYDPIPFLFGVGLSCSQDIQREKILGKPYWKKEDQARDALLHLANRTVHGTEVYFADSARQ